ncbi:MAG TPA: TonB-dependent receptor [Terriglobales bacterium]|nr:TonB-dependent receptor [Terriglobales bacterium]
MRVSEVKKILALFFFFSVPALGQTNQGELHFHVTDPSGFGVRTLVTISSEANQYSRSLATDEHGDLTVQRLPYGVYEVEVKQPGFADWSATIDVRSSVPADSLIRLKVAATRESLNVSAPENLVNPEQAGSTNQIGSETLKHRLSSIPGRSLQDLVNSQPGWLYEGNAVLHPRGSEYQTQFVVDGIPLTDNRSPSFGPEIEADDLESVTVYTAGFPAEYGRKMGGVVEVNTLEDVQPGYHGQVVLSGGSFDSAGAFGRLQAAIGKNIFSASASGDMTSHYLNPVVLENYTNKGTIGDFSAGYERDLSPKDRIRFTIRREFSRYLLPNEHVQEEAGQIQNADNFETMGIASYQHTFSSNAVADLRGMVRDNSNDFYSNPQSDPIILFQHNWFREGYFRGTMTINRGRHELKFGVESDNMFLNENFSYFIPANYLDQFDDGTPQTFNFAANRPDLEQSAFVQDQIRMGNWTANLGLRWDHYQLMLNRHAVDPRVAISRYFPSADLVVHVSYDRVFQTPSFENILLSSIAGQELNPLSNLQYAVEPSEGNYYEIGLTKAFFQNVKFDANYFRRDVSNYADDNQIQNTTISFPIAFDHSIIYGAEAKIELPNWSRFSGFLSYTYTLGNAWFPVSGGLFLGNDAQGIPTSGHFPDSQDQRHTLRGRLRYQVKPRYWIAAGVQYDTGLPFDFQCDPSLTLPQCIAGQAQIYGQQVIDRINFDRGRILPAFQVNASAGAELYRSERVATQFQIDGQNLTNIVNVIDFGGLFSGNAIGPSRSVMMRLTTNF